MRRRRFLAVSGALLAAPLAKAQKAQKAQKAERRFRIGVLQLGPEASIKVLDQAFLAGLRDRGYEIGQNLSVDFRYGDGDRSRLQALADELIALKPDVLAGTEVTSVVMKAKTSAIPIVLLISADPVAAGLVKSLARPGTNVTGNAGQLFTVVAKQVDLLTELVPKMSRVALLNDFWAPGDDSPHKGHPDPWEVALRAAATAKGLTPMMIRARDSETLREAFAALEKGRAQALVVSLHPVMGNLFAEIGQEARRLRLPTIGGTVAFVARGGLLSYGASFSGAYRYAAKYVDLILKGAKPAGLPVEQVAKFELAINQKTAREIGVKIPQSILLRADRVTE